MRKVFCFLNLASANFSYSALMPGGDHLNIIDPPGLTVMRIAGGRYRVTAAHRVVWTWMNEFVQLESGAGVNALQVGDLVTMTIVDVFETDNQGKLLSYCPTFDNRAVTKTHQTAETLRKSSNRLLTILAQARNSQTAKTILTQAQTVADTVKQKVEEAVHQYNGSGDVGSPRRNVTATSSYSSRPPGTPTLSAVEAAVEMKKQMSFSGSTHYLGDDEKERHEV